MCFAPQQRALFRHLNFQKWSETVGFWHFWLGNVLRATTACTFSISQLPKVVWDCGFLTLLTWKCASRHNSMHFFDISTSKSGPKLACFVHFDLEMCFAPQQHALFRHLNFQKWSEAGVFCTFWLGNVLRATTACISILTWKCASRHNSVHFFYISTSKSGLRPWVFDTFDLEMCFAPHSTSQLPKVVWDRGFLTLLTWKCASRYNGVRFFYISTSVWDCGFLTLLTWKCASRHNSVHFFDISTSKSGLRLWVFDTFDLEMCFAPQQHALFRHLNFQKWSEAGVFCTFWLGNVLRATTACTFSTSGRQKVVRTIPNMWCFQHFDMEMCFAPQQRALFRQLNFQKWSEREVFLSFWLGNAFASQRRALFHLSSGQLAPHPPL